MGRDKGKLLWNGMDFIDVVAQNLFPADELFLAPGQKNMYSDKPYDYVLDQFADGGPLAGIHAALVRCHAPSVFVVSCDMPLADWDFASELLSQMTCGTDAVIPIGADGRVHPLCAVYSKECVPVLERQLRMRKYRVRDALKQMEVVYQPLQSITDGDMKVTNINTPEEYLSFLGNRALGQDNIGEITMK
ncbi:MAG: molybdenum cofactor guanylyltransferase [Candidatus Ventricola sp.]